MNDCHTEEFDFQTLKTTGIRVNYLHSHETCNHNQAQEIKEKGFLQDIDKA